MTSALWEYLAVWLSLAAGPALGTLVVASSLFALLAVAAVMAGILAVVTAIVPPPVVAYFPTAHP